MTETKREVWNDVDDERRCEYWTDGEWIKVGRDVDEPDLCLTFRYEDELYDQFRNGDHPFTTRIEDDRGSDERYLVDQRGLGAYRFFKGRKLVLEVNDHELGHIRTAYRKARELRKADYDYQDVARSYVNGLFPNQIMLEITELGVGQKSPSGMVTVEHAEETVRIDDTFIQNIKDAEFADYAGVFHDIDGDCDGFRYRLKVDAGAIREADQ